MMRRRTEEKCRRMCRGLCVIRTSICRSLKVIRVRVRVVVALVVLITV